MKAYIVLSAALLAGCAASAAHESTGAYLDDTAITTKVKTELLTAKGAARRRDRRLGVGRQGRA